MKQAIDFLRGCQYFFIACSDGDQPCITPFRRVAEHHSNIYICADAQKNFFRCVQSNAKVELCGVDAQNGWIRIRGKISVDPGADAKEAFLAQNPQMGDTFPENYEVLYFVSGTVTLAVPNEPPISYAL